MDIKQLLEKMDQFAGQAVGQKPGDQWKGTDKGTPGKKLVGGGEQQESVLKDLSKGLTPKTKEQELAEEWATFSEENIGTHPKRPRRTSDRHARGHEPQPRYKTVKADEGAETAPAALADPIVAKVVKQMRPGLTGLDMGNEAFLYFAYELGKQRARDSWSDYLPAIRAEYEKGLAEGWESGPEEYKEPYDDADDAYDRQRQEKIDTEAEKEWAKLPKVSTYKLIGRGPNMEPNHEFGDEFDTLEQAVEYRAEIMKDPKTPHPEHIGIRTITRVVDKEQTNEAFYNAPKNKEDYDAKMTALQDLQMDPNTANDEELQKKIIIYMHNLQKVAHQQGWLSVAESRAHKVLDTWFKNRNLQDKFAKGELKVPTPQERRAELEKPKKQVKEYGATSTGSQPNAVTQTTGSAPEADDAIGTSTTNDADAKVQAAKIAQGANAIKSITGSQASAPNLVKSINTAMQGKADSTAAKDLQPVMDVIGQAIQDPQVNNSFKNLVQQAKQSKAKLQQQQK